jgi:hypothetical protein
MIENIPEETAIGLAKRDVIRLMPDEIDKLLVYLRMTGQPIPEAFRAYASLTREGRSLLALRLLTFEAQAFAKPGGKEG